MRPCCCTRRRDSAAKRLLIVGLGKLAKATVHRVRRRGGNGGSVCQAARDSRVGASTALIRKCCRRRQPRPGPSLKALSSATSTPIPIAAIARTRAFRRFTLAAPEGVTSAAVESAFAEGVIVGESQNFARSLVNEPGNKLTPTILGQRAAQMAQEVGLGWDVHSTEKLHELKMGAFWSVSQGSPEPPALIVLRYEPEGVTDGPVLGLVGKGITFDTGGISIKPADNMEMMKYDMAGGAAMLGAMRAIALLKPQVRVIAIVCAAENMPVGHGAKTGRRADCHVGEDHRDHQHRRRGAAGAGRRADLRAATGRNAPDRRGDTDRRHFRRPGQDRRPALSRTTIRRTENSRPRLAISGEKFWRLPLGEEYAELIKSDIGDIKNTGGRYGGASIAAEFLHVFAEDTPWIHLDIAGLAWVEESRPYIAKGPSGVAVRSILEWVRSYE